MRHTGAGLAIPDFPLAYGKVVPEIGSFAIGIHFAHRVGAVVVASLVLGTAVRVFQTSPRDPRRTRAALVLVALLATQLALGATIIWSRKAVLPTTAHVAVGAAILATSLVLALRSHRARESARSWMTSAVAQRAHA